jgi:hypothetical protein
MVDLLNIIVDAFCFLFYPECISIFFSYFKREFYWMCVCLFVLSFEKLYIVSLLLLLLMMNDE